MDEGEFISQKEYEAMCEKYGEPPVWGDPSREGQWMKGDPRRTLGEMSYARLKAFGKRKGKRDEVDG